MKRYFTCAVAKFASCIAIFLLLSYAPFAQNASYNANSIPIGGTYSTAFGVEAMKVNIGESNTGLGYRTLYSNSWGFANMASGCQALFSNTMGYKNTASGYQALYSNTSGFYNVANGSEALLSNTTGSHNTANGVGSLRYNTTGSSNTANGVNTLFYNATGSNNTANGFQALFSNTTGYRNTANGFEALHLNTIGFDNTTNGFQSLFFNTGGNRNTVNGFQALLSNIEGSTNVALGNEAGYNSLGSGNIYIGHRAGADETGSNKFYLGNDATNTLLYGDMTTRQILLGNANPTGYTFKGNRTLNVLGGVLADSIRVALSAQWADFVFDDNYQLMPLAEVNQFIKAHRHLPGLPSESEVKANGIELGEMNANLVAKIEELTLYLLHQQEQMKIQQQQIDNLKRLLEKKTATGQPANLR